jgi:hypothetical protein
MMDPLRFYFVSNLGRSGPGIADRKKSGKVYSPSSGRFAGASTDYAIVARFMDLITETWPAVGSAASEFVTQSNCTDNLASLVPKNDLSKSLETVISVQVIDGRPGAPHIEAVDASRYRRDVGGVNINLPLPPFSCDDSSSVGHYIFARTFW